MKLVPTLRLLGLAAAFGEERVEVISQYVLQDLADASNIEIIAADEEIAQYYPELMQLQMRT